MSFYPRRPPPSPPRGKSEFEILKSAHKFLRPDEENDASKSWDDQLARKYYDSLYKEYALCDLKHYKSGNFALRWRTENEVLSGAGEETCGNTRCSHHDRPDSGVKLTPVELPFVYAEEGQTKSALVKVVLCRKCLDKLMYKHRKEKERALPPAPESARQRRPPIAARPPYVVPANDIRGGAHATGSLARQTGQNANKNHRAEHRP
ncbi:hypothetical protein K525DRAFT_257692 [Schizophyllum commune Loenen D]|nr:hypothetical protein K525DRAFT_257692 [Schizophyllum commune Loenen D]